MDDWATLNEPLTAVVLAGYVYPSADRSNPPGLFFDLDGAKSAAANMIEAHARMYDAIHAHDVIDADGDGSAARVGIVYNVAAIIPADSSNSRDVDSSANARYLLNHMFLDAITNGMFDAQWDGNRVYRADFADRLDILGINYYAQLSVASAAVPIFEVASPFLTFDPTALQPDYSHPEAIADAIHDVAIYRVPMIISETGAEDSSGTAGPPWIVRTLSAIGEARQQGADIEGYYYWTLMDNYEWNHGMSIHMGLYEVQSDDPNKARWPRPSVGVYSRIAANRGIPDDLWAQYGN